jgi:hypothetical protein
MGLTQKKGDLSQLVEMNIPQLGQAHRMLRHEGEGILPRISESR